MKHCHHCNKDFSEDMDYCDTCGKKLSAKTGKGHHTKHEGHHNKPKIAPWLIPWIVFGILLAIAGVLLLPTKAVSYQIEVPYIDTEKYTVEVPYEDVEEYTVQVPYDTKEQYVESVPVQNEEKVTYTYEWAQCSSTGIFFNGYSTIKITNTYNQPASFNVRIGYTDSTGKFVYTTQTKNINQFQSDTFTYTPTPSSFNKCSFDIPNPPVYTKTEYKDVIKERTVTKYRDETKYRKVTKTRTETREKEVRKTRTETKQKEVTWLFGFDAIIKFRNLS